MRAKISIKTLRWRRYKNRCAGALDRRFRSGSLCGTLYASGSIGTTNLLPEHPQRDSAATTRRCSL